MTRTLRRGRGSALCVLTAVLSLLAFAPPALAQFVFASPGAAWLMPRDDANDPTLTISGVSNGWVSGPQNLTVSASGGSGAINEVSCSIDDGSQTNTDGSSEELTVSGNGTHTVACSASTTTGGAATTSALVEIDNQVPQISFSDDGSAVPTGWGTTPQTITAAATEATTLSGIASLTCSVDGQPQSSTNPAAVTVSGDGEHQLACVAQTGAGVSSGAITTTVDIDTEVPQVTITGPPESSYESGEAALTVVADDPGPSGIAQVQCAQDAGQYAPIAISDGIGSFTVSGASGQHTASCYAVTNAGVSSAGELATYTVALDDGDDASGGGTLTQYGSSPLIDGGSDPYSDGPSQTTWSQLGESVQVTAGTASGAQIDEITCSGAASGTWDTANGEPVTVAVGAPGGTLTCTAVDTAGNYYPLGNYAFLIDDTPPTAYFVGRDPDALALVRVSAVDAGSGVASVTITYTCRSGPCMTADRGSAFKARTQVATYDRGDGYWQVTALDNGAWPNGTYALTAKVDDVAGNSAVVAALADGDAATVTLPARVSTDLATSLPGGRQTATLNYGAATTLSGELRDRADAAPIAGATVTIEQRLLNGSATRLLGRARTNNAGDFSYHLPAGANRTVTAVYAGTTILHPASASVTERFRGHVTLRLHGVAVAGQTLVLSGRVASIGASASGVLVQPRYQVAGSSSVWAPFGDAVTTGRDGDFTIRVPLSPLAGGFTYRLDVLVQAQSGFDYRTSDSSAVIAVVDR